MFLVLFITEVPYAGSDTTSMPLFFFGSPSCKICQSIKQDILWPAEKRYPNINVEIYDITSDSGYAFLMNMEEQHKVPVSSAITLFLPDTFISGGNAIKEMAPDLIKRYVTGKKRTRHIRIRNTEFGKTFIPSFAVGSLLARTVSALRVPMGSTAA